MTKGKTTCTSLLLRGKYSVINCDTQLVTTGMNDFPQYNKITKLRWYMQTISMKILDNVEKMNCDTNNITNLTNYAAHAIYAYKYELWRNIKLQCH